MRMTRVDERGEQDRRGGADRRPGVRAVGAHRPSAPAAQIELRVVSGTLSRCRRPVRRRRRDRRHHRSRRQPRRGDAGAGAADAADRRLAAGGGGDAELRRRGGAPPAADAGGGFPGQAGAAGRTGAHLRAGRPADREPRPTEAQIYTFLPAVGGAGVTTLAIQTALLLLNSGQRGRPTTCLVDLDFQHGACADYLDLEPRLDLKEIEPRPERLDRQLLEIMLSHHASGLAVIAAPNRPAEMRTFDPDMVTRLLDLVSSHFDYVVIDMPRTWFSWTDSVLLGSNRLFIVSEMTVPSLRHAKQLVAAIRERLGDGPQPQVIVNRFEQRMFDAGPEEGRPRAGARRRFRRHHSEQLSAGARGDRSRRAARRGQAGQQDHAPSSRS